MAEYVADQAKERGDLWTSTKEGLYRLRYGWVAVAGPNVIASDKSKPILLLENPSSIFKRSGTLGSWTKNFSPLLDGNPMLLWAFCFGLSSVVATMFNLPRPNLLLWGASSTGKTTIGRVIISVYGTGEPFQWTATNNGIEALLAKHRDAPLVLDELGARGRTGVADAIYRLSSGFTKARATSTGSLRQPEPLRSVVFATGEISISQHAAVTGETLQAGNEVRMPGVQVDGPYGVYDDIHSAGSSAEFARRVSEALKENYGVLYPEFLMKVLPEFRLVESLIAERIDKVRAKVARPYRVSDLSDIERRVLDQFTTVAMTGAIAATYSIFPVKPGVAIAASANVYSRWLRTWRARNEEPKVAPLHAVQEFLKIRGPAAFLPLKNWEIHKRGDLAGYTKEHKGEQVFLIYPEVFRKELCQLRGVDATLQALQSAGFLVTPKKGNQLLVRMPGSERRMTFYAVRRAAIFDEESAASAD